MRRGAMAEGGNDGDRNWSMWLRLLSHSVRDTAGSTSADDTTVLRAVKNLHRLCAKGEQNDDLVGRVYPHLVKIFNRCSASLLSQKASTGLLLLAILQFFLDFGEIVLHDSDPSLRTFFRSCLSRQYADATVAAATLKFLNQNKAKLVVAHPALLPQYYPLLLKLVAWGSSKLDQAFTDLLPALTGPSSFLPLFPALLDLPTLVLALENIQSSSGAAPGTSSGSKKSPAPEVLLALMDEAYTGSVIADSQGDDGAGAKDEPEAFFADLLKDENEGLAERHWSFPGMAAALQSLVGSSPSERLQHAMTLAPILLHIYFTIALRDVNDLWIVEMLLMPIYRFEIWMCLVQAQKLLLEFVLAAFQQSPHLVAVLKKPIMDRVGQLHTSTAKTELALQLCWAIGEHSGGDFGYKAAARELFETLELLLYENLPSSRMKGTDKRNDDAFRESAISQSRLLCSVVTAIAKLATCHRELSPRPRVCLSKVARSQQVLDISIWRSAHEFLGLMHKPAMCSSILGPPSGYPNRPGSVQWSEGGTKAVASIPFYALGEKAGPPFHDFSLQDVIGKSEARSKF
nr:AP-5 complex subunit zeta-1-like [Physcomitrium patens]|eukprot:XP_024363066.1 AP-5 complex subunit zeta-1-like [Physcomitrella patens]